MHRGCVWRCFFTWKMLWVINPLALFVCTLLDFVQHTITSPSWSTGWRGSPSTKDALCISLEKVMLVRTWIFYSWRGSSPAQILNPNLLLMTLFMGVILLWEKCLIKSSLTRRISEPILKLGSIWGLLFTSKTKGILGSEWGMHMELAILNLGLAYARLAWPTHFKSDKLGSWFFYSPALFLCMII